MNNHYKRQKQLKNQTNTIDTRPDVPSASDAPVCNPSKDPNSALLQPL
jgi:hypothetical protein